MPVAMTKKERELRQKFTQKKQEASNLLEDGKPEEARSMLEEAKELQSQIELMTEGRSLELPEIGEERNFAAEIKSEPKKETEERNILTATKEYREAWLKVLTGRSHDLETEERNMMERVLKENRSLSAGSDKDGGYTVPDDISKEILKSIQELNSVRNLIRVVPKTAPSGNYTVRKGVAGKLYNTAEKEQIKELKNMEFDQIWYNVKKFAGIMPVSSELLNDSFVNFVREIVDWLSESAIVTENDEVFYGKGGETNVEGIITSGKYKTLKAPSVITIKFLRKVKNQINRGYRRSAVWVMNTEAFETLANIEDKNGRGILAEDPRNEDNFLLFGRPVEVYDEILTDDKTQKTHILFGDFKRGYFMFDRQKFEIKSTDVGGDAFLTDQTYFRGIERFDGKVVDPEAAVIVTDLVVGEDAKVETPEQSADLGK
ncbi:major capsid protein [Bacillus amyloliquefaciens]|uniref:Phage major capsid protein n=2 Tax=Bacillus velezensis TaxID=492670 RepID=A0A6A8LLD1_BACVE|nr:MULTISPECIES: phage major capsid protein [Bacillus amyloliquefaciens group]APB82552.1 major capsid protein [Bacillus amyloliquefaciens]AWM83431.1 phage major capsid protein [Bacillus velezensis]MED2913526.1 phage major capsid protein [Bacillus velezensis]MSD98995.1 phage major capsid protein [Bacillus velezensis]MSE04091.1 phage major capsid protein [Bacillus velezensis]